MAAFLAYRPDGSRVRLGFDLHQGAYDTAELIRVLEGLPDRLGGPITLIWDNLPAHKSCGMRDWVSQQAGWLEVVQLPAYAPDLNPVEGLWSTLKGCDLANHGCYTAEEVIRLAQVGLIRLRRAPELLWGFLRHAGLSLATSPT